MDDVEVSIFADSLKVISLGGLSAFVSHLKYTARLPKTFDGNCKFLLVFLPLLSGWRLAQPPVKPKVGRFENEYKLLAKMAFVIIKPKIYLILP